MTRGETLLDTDPTQTKMKMISMIIRETTLSSVRKLEKLEMIETVEVKEAQAVQTTKKWKEEEKGALQETGKISEAQTHPTKNLAFIRTKTPLGINVLDQDLLIGEETIGTRIRQKEESRNTMVQEKTESSIQLKTRTSKTRIITQELILKIVQKEISLLTRNKNRRKQT